MAVNFTREVSMVQPLIIVMVFIVVGIIKALSLKVALFIVATACIFVVKSWLGARPEKLQLSDEYNSFELTMSII